MSADSPTAPRRPSSGSGATCGSRDQPTFLAAADAAARSLALFVLDPALLDPAGAARRTFLYRSLRALDEALGGRLLVVRGDPADVVPRVAAAVDAAAGARRRRLRALRRGAATRPWRRRWPTTGASWCAPARPTRWRPAGCARPTATPFQVFTPFRRAWAEHGWRSPADTDAAHRRLARPGASKDGGPRAVPRSPTTSRVDAELPDAGEEAARQQWQAFLDAAVADYERRPQPARQAGHLADVGVPQVRRDPPAHAARRPGRTRPASRPRSTAPRSPGASSTPTSCTSAPTPPAQNYDKSVRRAARSRPGQAATSAFDAWCEGRTGFPIVDAGMRQLREQAWMHNRVRMIVASFLVKDLHLPWWWGARHFMRPARRRRPGLQPARLAVDGGQRHRRRRRTSGCSTRSRRGRSSTPTATTCAGSCPSCAASRARRCTSRGRCPAGPRTATRSRWSTTRPSAQEALARYEQVKAARAC